jgi:hypothetical protein
MAEKGSHFQEKIDTFVTRLTRNKVTERKLGPMTVLIHERRLGKWTKVLTSHSEVPIRGKTHDIVYTIFDGHIERTRLGKMAREQQPLTSALRASPAT